MNFGTCKFCGQERDLVRAHIIPQALYPADAKGNRMQIVLDGKGELPPSKLANGEYDPDLVCRPCEDLFNVGDDYAKRLLIDQRGECVRRSEGGTTYFQYENVDYQKLKLFFISLLWRAHATALRAFDQVDLGSKYEAITKQMLRGSDLGTPHDFAVLMVRIEEGPLDKIGASPTPRRLPPNNVRAYEFLLFGYIAYVKVDQKRYGYPFEAAQLTPGKPFWMLEKQIEQTPFVRFAREARGKANATVERLRNASHRG